jgi:FkbM family methyltransferase
VLTQEPTILDLLAPVGGPFVYVDCGARGDSGNALVDLLPGARYLGFEPDHEECARLNQQARARYQYFPVALGRASESRIFYVTNNPACSSLLMPDDGFWGRFQGCLPQIEVKETQGVETVSLDSYLPAAGLDHVDFLELDTQGTELDILQGAEKLLASCVLGIRVEAEFSPMYQDQPLFSDIDAYARRFGFMLFDLSRHRYRREHYPSDLQTRGQLLYGHAFYMKDYQRLPEDRRKEAALRLVLIAVFHGFHDYALEVMDYLLKEKAGLLSSEESERLGHARAQYFSSASGHRWIKLMLRLEKSPFRKLFHWAGKRAARIGAAYSFVKSERNYSWSD